MNLTTFYLFTLLKDKAGDSFLLKELISYQRRNLISEELTQYILQKRNISYLFYSSVYQAVEKYNHYDSLVLQPH